MRRQCLTCPAGVLMGRDYCWQCRQLRERQQKAERRRRMGMVARRDDFPAHVIEARYLRAVHAKNPRKARLLQERAA